MGMRSKHRTMALKKKTCLSSIGYKSEMASRRNSSVSVSSISLPEQLEGTAEVKRKSKWVGFVDYVVTREQDWAVQEYVLSGPVMRVVSTTAPPSFKLIMAQANLFPLPCSLITPPENNLFSSLSTKSFMASSSSAELTSLTHCHPQQHYRHLGGRSRRQSRSSSRQHPCSNR
jgi:hypothetical protein